MDKLPNVFSGILNNLVNKVVRTRIERTRLLLQFKRSLVEKNQRLIYVMQSTKDNKGNIQINKKVQSGKYKGMTFAEVGTEIILFISTWCIRLQQKIIRPSDIKNNFNFNNELIILSPVLSSYLSNKNSLYYYDAKKCKQFLVDCDRIVNGDDA